MARRRHMPCYPDSHRGHDQGISQSVFSRRQGPLLTHEAALEEELEIQLQEVQKITAENQLLFNENTLIRRELMAVRDKIHGLDQGIPKLQADKETEARELIHRKLKLEAELRAFDPLKTEVMQLRAEVENLTTLEEQLIAEVQVLKQDIAQAHDENQQLATLRANADQLRRELVASRRAFEYEKKAKEEQIQLRQLMQNDLFFKAHEIENLQAELMKTEKKARGGGGYGTSNGSHELKSAQKHFWQ